MTSARAKVITTPTEDPPARTNLEAKPILRPPARATDAMKPSTPSPARANEEPTRKDDAPARATPDATPNPRTPARASLQSEPTVDAPARAILRPTTIAITPARADVLTIRTLANVLDDLEKVRIENSNRIGAMERSFGDALLELRVIDEQLAAVEHQAVLQLQRAWRKHALAPWAKQIPGCGEKLIARLIAIIGDPYIAQPHHWEGTGQARVLVADEPYRRTVSQLWTYCGVGDPVRSAIAKGATAEELFKRGNPAAKKASWKIAYQFMRTPQSSYRDVYLQKRKDYDSRVHERECPHRRCSSDSAVGRPWRPAHQHAAALRYVQKLFLKDLWLEARRLNEEQS